MFFRTSPANRPARMAAGAILLCFGLALTVTGAMPLIAAGVALWGAGLAAVCINVYQAVTAGLRRRRDPYDLSRLWEEPLPEEAPLEPETDALDADLVYCHRCGASMDDTFK